MATEPPIGTKIKKRRQILDMTQQDLAGALGVSKSTVANWERGKHFPLRYLGRIEHVLSIRLDEDAGHARTVSPKMRQDIAEYLDDEEDRRYVIGILEGTITRPNGPQGQAPGRTAEDGTPAARQTGG